MSFIRLSSQAIFNRKKIVWIILLFQIKKIDMQHFCKNILFIPYNRYEKRPVASKLKLVKSTMTSLETATTIPLPVAQMTPPSKVPHSPICSSPESIDAGFYDIEVGSNLTSNNASSINGDEYQLVSATYFQPDVSLFLQITRS